MLTVALRVAAGRAVKMTVELITPNVPARPCMNGARRRKNVSARRGTNTLAPAATSAAVRAIAVTTNIKSVNVPQAIPGMRRPELVSAAVATNTPARGATLPAGRVRLAAENIPPANAQPDLLGIHQAACVFAMALTGVRSIKTALV